MNPEAPETESEVIRRSAAILTERLPAGWLAQLTISPDKRSDGLLEVASADGRTVKFVIEAKRVVDGRDVDSNSQPTRAVHAEPCREPGVGLRPVPVAISSNKTDRGRPVLR